MAVKPEDNPIPEGWERFYTKQQAREQGRILHQQQQQQQLNDAAAAEITMEPVIQMMDRRRRRYHGGSRRYHKGSDDEENDDDDDTPTFTLYDSLSTIPVHLTLPCSLVCSLGDNKNEKRVWGV